MASNEKMLEILVGESGPMNRAVLGKRLGEPTSSFATQLGRMEKQGLVEKNEQNEYTITEAGRQFALANPPPPPEDTPPGEETEETLGTTEYQQFIDIGRSTGVVPMALIEQTANHVWRGGDFRDLSWVWKGLTEMGIRPDLAQRWFHSWRSFLHQAIPAELATEVGVPQIGGKGTTKAEAVGKGKRDYILGLNDTPLFVGEGTGDLDYEDAVRLSAVKAASLARGGAQVGQLGQGTPGSMAEEVIKIFNAFKETMGGQVKGKSYIVKPGEEGFVVEEVVEGKPTIIASPGKNTSPPSASWMVDTEGNVTEMAPGKPVVIKQPAAATNPQATKTYVVTQTSEGTKVEEHDLSKPIIINPAPLPSSGPGSGMTPMYPFPVMNAEGKAVLDEAGNPVYANIEPMMRYLSFQNEQKRADDRHAGLMSLIQLAKENIPAGIQAFTRATAAQKQGGGKKQKNEPEQTVECSKCKTKFALPQDPWEFVVCPNPECGTQYSREQVFGEEK